MEEVKRVFKPEFLNRIDEIIVFHKLNREDIREICAKMLDLVKARMEAIGVKLVVDGAAIDLLAEQGYDPVYGARPLRRAIQSAVEDTVAERMLEGKIREGDAAAVIVADGAIEIKRR